MISKEIKNKIKEYEKQFLIEERQKQRLLQKDLDYAYLERYSKLMKEKLVILEKWNKEEDR